MSMTRPVILRRPRYRSIGVTVTRFLESESFTMVLRNCWQRKARSYEYEAKSRTKTMISDHRTEQRLSHYTPTH
jgi:hypothetical protein